MDERMLRAIAQDVCSVQRFYCESACFVPSDIADILWHHGREGIPLLASDLLRGLPPEFMMEFLDSAFSRAIGLWDYMTDSLRDYLGKGGLVRSSRKEYVERNGLESSQELDSAMARLRESGHLPAIPYTLAYWDPNPIEGKAVRVSPAFQAVMVNPVLKDSDPVLLEFVAHMGASSAYQVQVSPGNRREENLARDRRISDYPGLATMRDRLVAIGLRNRRGRR